MSNAYFRFFNIEIARAITLTGQTIIQEVSRGLDSYLNSAIGTKDYRYSFYGDTDSVDFNTSIYYDGKSVAIGDLYEKFSEYIVKDDDNQNYVKKAYGKSLSFNTSTESVENNNVTYIMKHKVKKRMYKITVNGKEVVVTEDHSVIVKRDNKYISSKPKDIRKGDIILTLKE